MEIRAPKMEPKYRDSKGLVRVEEKFLPRLVIMIKTAANVSSALTTN